jgi:hypothetical protein
MNLRAMSIRRLSGIKKSGFGNFPVEAQRAASPRKIRNIFTYNL